MNTDKKDKKNRAMDDDKDKRPFYEEKNRNDLVDLGNGIAMSQAEIIDFADGADSYD